MLPIPVFGRLLRSFGRGGGLPVGFTWLLRAEFTQNVPAPLPASQQVEVGQLDFFGTLANLSESGDNLVIASAAVINDPIVAGHVQYTRSSGLALISEFNPASATERWQIGWAPSQNISNLSGIYFRPANFIDISDNGITCVNATNDSFVVGTSYPISILQKSAGVDVFWKLNGVWKLQFVDIAGNANCYPVAAPAAATAAVGTMAWFRVRQMGNPFSNAHGLTVTDQSNPTTGNLFTSVADAVHVMQFSLPGSPNAGDTITLEYRRQDTNNKWTLSAIRNAGNTAWDLQLRVVTGGTPATPGGWADIIGVGSVDTFQVITDGNTHVIYTKIGTVWTRQSNPVSSASFNTAMGLSAVYAVGSVSLLMSKPRTDTRYNQFDYV